MRERRDEGEKERGEGEKERGEVSAGKWGRWQVGALAGGGWRCIGQPETLGT